MHTHTHTHTYKAHYLYCIASTYTHTYVRTAVLNRYEKVVLGGIPVCLQLSVTLAGCLLIKVFAACFILFFLGFVSFWNVYSSKKAYGCFNAVS